MEKRIIKFKAKRLDNGEWAEGDIAHALTGGLNILGFEVNKTGEVAFTGANPVDPSTVCQFTGIYDEEGKWIYENDLVQFLPNGNIFVVVWNPIYACYSFLDEESNKYAAINFAGYSSNKMIVVGNKFDRKEEK